MVGISYTSSIGAIAGKAIASTIKNCVNKNITIIGYETSDGLLGGSARGAGGIVGYASEGCIISNCINNGTIYASDNGGGIIGRSDTSTIIDCKNNGIINITGTFGETEAVGGIVGYVKNNSVKYCINTATIESSGTSKVGGIIGYINLSSNCEIYNCRNTGVIEGYSTSGGIIGGISNELSDRC